MWTSKNTRSPRFEHRIKMARHDLNIPENWFYKLSTTKNTGSTRFESRRKTALHDLNIWVPWLYLIWMLKKTGSARLDLRRKEFLQHQRKFSTSFEHQKQPGSTIFGRHRKRVLQNVNIVKNQALRDLMIEENIFFNSWLSKKTDPKRFKCRS